MLVIPTCVRLPESNKGPPLSPWHVSLPPLPAATIRLGKYVALGGKGTYARFARESETTGTDTSRIRFEGLPPSLVTPQPATVSLRPGVSRLFWFAVATLIGWMPVTARSSFRTATSYELFFWGL